MMSWRDRVERRGGTYTEDPRAGKVMGGCPCQTPGCPELILPGKLFCRSHWTALPTGLRDGIYAAMRRPERMAGAKQAAINWLMQAAPAQPFKQERSSQMQDTVEKIASIAHEVNRAYCAALGDHSQPAWQDAPEWQRTSAVKGVQFTLSNPGATPEASHESWLEEKRRDGWTYGPVKDPARKQHPCFVPYGELPQDQRVKDYLFQAAVRSAAAALR